MRYVSQKRNNNQTHSVKCYVFLLCHSLMMRLSSLRALNVRAFNKLFLGQLSFKTSQKQLQMNDYKVMGPLEKGLAPKSFFHSIHCQRKELVLEAAWLAG